ncbi:MAG TPA: SIS domain-containing protein [Firmicutes bacterium]|jgi:arabinose-5-phosphate isomerase|nr:SIS domain-containing protein [Bacillota bacterium]
MSQIVRCAKEVFRQEAAALERLSEQIGAEYEQAVQLILSTQGKVIVSGMGKAGHIGKKAAASLASTGTPAFFVHPAEALHGDAGMVTAQDLVMAISNSGETAELLSFLAIVQDIGAPIIAITGGLQSRLSKMADVTLAAQVEREADPLNLAPTTSAVAQLAVADALVVCVMAERGFTTQDFRRYHPGGALGKRLA